MKSVLGIPHMKC